MGYSPWDHSPCSLKESDMTEQLLPPVFSEFSGVGLEIATAAMALMCSF